MMSRCVGNNCEILGWTETTASTSLGFQPIFMEDNSRFSPTVHSCRIRNMNLEKYRAMGLVQPVTELLGKKGVLHGTDLRCRPAPDANSER